MIHAMQDRITFGHYRVCQREDGSRVELGRGAAGVTLKAVDVNLDCPVVLKVLNADLFRDDASRADFVREARAAARLRHRHIASVYHLGSEQDHIFYAMELVEGETAEQLVKRAGPLPPETALRIALQAARALAAAQREGIVHGDIKPANLLIAADPSDATDVLFVKVIDFGMAFSFQDAALAERDFTPEYASPEQVEQRAIDGRSDIYSLGCTLWFLLTGHPPFARRLADMIEMRGEPRWEELEKFPPVLRKLLRIMLRRNPAERPRDGIEVQRAIEMCLASIERWHILQARLAGALSEARRWMAGRSRRQAAALAGVALLAAISAIGAWAWFGEAGDPVAVPPLATVDDPVVPVADASRNPEPEGRSLHHLALRDAAWLAVSSSHPDAVDAEPNAAPNATPDATPIAALEPVDENSEEAAPAPVKNQRASKTSSRKRYSQAKADRNSKNPLVRAQRSVRDLLARLF
jgi:tRNA A-37 threonylcarbamoyl transferase component Bud32